MFFISRPLFGVVFLSGVSTSVSTTVLLNLNVKSNYFQKWRLITSVFPVSFYLNCKISFWQSSREQDSYLSSSPMFIFFICFVALDSYFNFSIGWFSKSVNALLSIKNFNFSLKGMEVAAKRQFIRKFMQLKICYFCSSDLYCRK